MGDVPAPRSGVSGQGTGDGSLAGGLVCVDEDFLAVGSQPYSPGLGFADAVFGSEFARAQERHDGLVDQEWAELFHEVQRQAGPLIGGRVCDAEGGLEPGGVQRTDAFGQEDGAPVGQGSVGQVAGWTPAAPIEGDVGKHARGERVKVGVGARAFDAHAFVEDAVGLACGVVAGPGGPRVDADVGECFLIVNILGRQVGDARPCCWPRQRWCRSRRSGVARLVPPA